VAGIGEHQGSSWYDEGRHTDVVPILFREVQSWGPSLYSGAVYKDVDLATHQIESALEQRFDSFEIAEIAREEAGRAPVVSNLIVGVHDGAVWREMADGGPMDETDGSASVCQGSSASSTDPCHGGLWIQLCTKEWLLPTSGSAGDEYIAAV
jgi:hypothetical protein